MTRFPLSRRAATVLLVVELDLLDQTVDPLARWSSRITRLPSRESRSLHDERLAIGFSRLATQTGVNLGTVLNQIPRYHFGVLLEELRSVWKKPSANLPLLDRSLSPLASSRPAEMVSVAAWHGRMCRWRERRIPKTTRGTAGFMAMIDGME